MLKCTLQTYSCSPASFQAKRNTSQHSFLKKVSKISHQHNTMAHGHIGCQHLQCILTHWFTSSFCTPMPELMKTASMAQGRGISTEGTHLCKTPSTSTTEFRAPLNWNTQLVCLSDTFFFNQGVRLQTTKRHGGLSNKVAG